MKLLRITGYDDYASMVFQKKYKTEVVVSEMERLGVKQALFEGWIEVELIEVNTPEEMFDLYKKYEHHEKSIHSTMLKAEI